MWLPVSHSHHRHKQTKATISLSLSAIWFPVNQSHHRGQQTEAVTMYLSLSKLCDCQSARATIVTNKLKQQSPFLSQLYDFQLTRATIVTNKLKQLFLSFSAIWLPVNQSYHRSQQTKAVTMYLSLSKLCDCRSARATIVTNKLKQQSPFLSQLYGFQLTRATIVSNKLKQ